MIEENSEPTRNTGIKDFSFKTLIDLPEYYKTSNVPQNSINFNQAISGRKTAVAKKTNFGKYCQGKWKISRLGLLEQWEAKHENKISKELLGRCLFNTFNCLENHLPVRSNSSSRMRCLSQGRSRSRPIDYLSILKEETEAKNKNKDIKELLRQKDQIDLRYGRQYSVTHLFILTLISRYIVKKSKMLKKGTQI